MRLKTAAKYFDRDSVYDAYTGLYLFKAQFASYDGASPDGSFSRRRTVSVAPEVIDAPRGAVTVHGEKWLTGNFISDGFFDEPIRKTASAKAVTDMFEFLTPGQAALDLAPVKLAYGQARYLKDTVNTVTNANYSPQYEISFSPTEDVPDEYFLKDSTHTYHIRTVNRVLEGFMVATADVIETTSFGESSFVTVVFSGTVDPITELASPGATTTGVLLYAYKLYELATQADGTNQPGDKILIVAQTSVIPVSGSTITIDGEPYRIVTYQGYYDAWRLKVRRA